MARTGRRPGPSTTRATILEAARRRFADRGYDATSIRAIAAEAGVDPGVVMHSFGSKDALFQAAVGWPFDPARLAAQIAARRRRTPRNRAAPFDPARLAAQIAAPGPEGIGARIARAFLGSWEDPTTRASLAGVLRSAMTHDASAALLREFVVHLLFARVTGLVGGPQAELRASLATSHLIGVAILRYTLRVEPIASASTDQLVAWLTPALTHYLGPGRSDGRESALNAGRAPHR